MFFYVETISAVPLILTASVNSLTFPSTCIGTSSLMTVSISAASLVGSEVEIVSVGDDSDQFDFSPASFALTGGVTNQLIDVTFTPTSWGQKSASLTLNASNGSIVTVHLEGLAAAVPLVLTSSVNSISFTNTLVNTTSSQTFDVSAGGFSSVVETVTLSDTSNQFDFSPASFALTGSGATQTVTAKFTPSSTGTVNGTLILSSSGGDMKNISMSGLSYGPLVLTSSTNLMTFNNIAVNSSSSQNLTISAGGYATETVTLTDNTNHYDYTPSTFTLTGGGSQVVAVNFKPLSSSYRTGVATISSSGGSTKSLIMSGSATLQNRAAVGSDFAYTSSVLVGQAKQPENPPNGSEGWYFKNTTTQKIDWEYWSLRDMGVSEITALSGTNVNAYMVVNYATTGSITKALAGNGPYINIYTTSGSGPGPNVSWFKSRWSYYHVTGVLANYVTGSDYLLYTQYNPEVHPEIPANRRYKLTTRPINTSTTTGSFLAGQEINNIRVGTNSNLTPLNSLEFTIRGMGVQFTDRMDEVVCLKSGSV